MSGMSLNRDLERALCEAVKAKHGSSWRPQDVEGVRAMGYLLRKAVNRGWNQHKRKKCIAINKAEKVGDLKTTLPSDMEIKSLEISQLILVLFGPVCSNSQIWNGNVYPV